jgi:hypothetical protein
MALEVGLELVDVLQCWETFRVDVHIMWDAGRGSLAFWVVVSVDGTSGSEQTALESAAGCRCRWVESSKSMDGGSDSRMTL